MPWNNLNTCYSVTDVFTTALKQLSAYNCSEVIILNLGASPLRVWDTNSTASVAGTSFIVPPSAEFTFRGLTNGQEVSASFISGSGTVTYRTQFFSSFPLTVY